jgi:hypothetical protein
MKTNGSTLRDLTVPSLSIDYVRRARIAVPLLLTSSLSTLPPVSTPRSQLSIESATFASVFTSGLHSRSVFENGTGLRRTVARCLRECDGFYTCALAARQA